MELKNKFCSILLSLPICFQANAGIVLPELMAKQSLSNIRFLSQDGKYTYYQKRSGSLLLSTNYKVFEMLKSDIGTEYNLTASPARKKILILQNPNFHNFYSLRAKQKIYITDFGDSSAREIGFGISPQLLLDDTWLSYYDSYQKVLNFENTTNSALKFSIRLNNRINPYFIPMVLMSDENTVYYTDLGENGSTGLLEFKRNTAKSEIIFKAQNPMQKIEFCQKNDQFIFAIFGIHGSNIGTNISKVILPIKDFNKRETIYKSDLNDLGHMVCNYDNTHMSFIKNFGTTTNPLFDLAEIELNSGKLSPLSDFKSASNIINMDGILLTENRGKYYIAKGDVDFKNVDSLKAKQHEPISEQPMPKQKEKSLEKELENE